VAQNPKGRHIWPGLFTSRIGQPTKSYVPEEVLQQIKVTRARPGATGHVHFSMAAIMENRQGIGDQLKAVHYTAPALVPATPWLGNFEPGTPSARARRGPGGVRLRLQPGGGNAHFAIWSRHGAEWKFAVVPATALGFHIADDARLGPASAVFLSAVDRLGNETRRVSVPVASAADTAK
jgi:hypothetical protein